MNEKIRKYFENPRTIKNVRPTAEYALILTFDNGEIKKYDMSDELTGVFSVLKNKEKFNEVFINDVGNVAWNINNNIDSTVCWNNQIDLCKDELYMDSVNI